MIAADAALLEAAAAEPLALADAPPSVADADGLADEPPEEPPLLLPPEASKNSVALRVPQMKDWQKVWPARSLGRAAVH